MGNMQKRSGFSISSGSSSNLALPLVLVGRSTSDSKPGAMTAGVIMEMIAERLDVDASHATPVLNAQQAGSQQEGITWTRSTLRSKWTQTSCAPSWPN